MKSFFIKQIVVWTMISIGSIVFFIFVYMIGSNKRQILSPFVFYKTILEDVSGIYVGTKVSIHGKNSGNISKMEIQSDGSIKVHFTIQKKHSFLLTTSSFIEIKTAGALGDNYLNIKTPNLSQKQLKKGEVIPYKPSQSLFSLFMNQEHSLVQNLLTQLNQFLEQFNKENFKLLSKKQNQDLTEILKSTKNILKKVESGEGSLGALIYDPSLYNRLLILLGQRPSKNYLKSLSKKSHEKK